MAEKKSILITDDELGLLKLLKDTFEMRGWKVFTTLTGNSVLSILNENKVNLVLLDIRLPDRSGLEVLKGIKAAHPETPVVMLTALGYDDELVEEAIKLGASGYVSKTVSINDLIETVNNALAQ